MPDFAMEGSVRVRIELLGVFAAGAVLGIWHLGMGGRALFVFRSDEPFSPNPKITQMVRACSIRV